MGKLKNKEGNNNMTNKKRSVESRFNILLITVCVVLPIIFVLAHDLLAGGIFNSFAGGTYKKGMIDPSVLRELVYPLITLICYGLLVYEFIKLSRKQQRTPFKVFLMILATVITLLIVFWKNIVT